MGPVGACSWDKLGASVVGAIATFGGGVYVDIIPSPLGSGESSTWEISSNGEFEPNENSAVISFLIGHANRHIDVTLYYAIGSGNC
ncbi:hypothetical protein O5O45_08420 [Hahella aquimaris]|uniref:hypothetical protein n=1 Tax=Hahella sp. HNIBRBA332 TaxID=3015983 RepID=UPI00273AFB4F|nr:hypothetical protein [Hahella sp. HNIBRBA332]WLQ15938.1 hypothetical protein O5O45_08420 [Hahella sp. HNIBRBA332]